MIVTLNKTVWSVTLIAVFAILVNNVVFIHTHILPDGRVIEHAHPFNSTDRNSDSQPNHHHTSQEFLLLSFIYHFFSSVYTLKKRANGWKLIHPYGDKIDTTKENSS